MTDTDTQTISDLVWAQAYHALFEAMDEAVENLPEASSRTIDGVIDGLGDILNAIAEWRTDEPDAFEPVRASALGRDGGEAPLNDEGVAELDRIFGYREPRVGDYVACKHDGDFGTVSDISVRARGTVYEIAWAGHDDFTTWEHADALRIVGEKY